MESYDRLKSIAKGMFIQGSETNTQGIFNTIFTSAPNLKQLSVSGILLNGGVYDYQLLGKSIREKKLKSLTLLSPITDTNAFKMVCESLADSEIETLTLKESYPHRSREEDMNNLIRVIPRMKFLKNLNLDGQDFRNKDLLFRALEETNVEYLSIGFYDLNDNDALLLAHLISSTNLMKLDIQDHVMSMRGLRALEAAKEMKPGFQLRSWPRESD